MYNPSRRQILHGLAIGTALAAAGPAAAADGSGLDPLQQDGEAPWWMLSPLGPGVQLARGWRLVNLSPIRKGAAVVTLEHPVRGPVELHLCAREGEPRGMASTALVDLVLMDGSDGATETDEDLGRVIGDLASRIRKNELEASANLRPLGDMLPHDERVDTYGPEFL